MFRNIKLRDKHYIFFIILLALLFFNGIFLHPELTYTGRDSLDIYAFEYHHRYKTFQENDQLAFWNPYYYSGMPFFPAVGRYYLFNILFLLNDSFQILNLYQLFHIALAGILMYGFARLIKLNSFCSFITAIIFMFGGNILTKVGGAYPQLASYALLPLMFIFLELLIRKKQFIYSIFLGIALAFLFFAGHQQYFYMISLTLLIYLLLNLFKNPYWKKTFIFFGLAYIIAFLLSSIYVLPIFELSNHLNRLDYGLSGGNYDYIASGSLPLKQLTNFIMPNLYGNGWNVLANGFTTYWGAPTYNELYVYMGLIPLFLILFAFKNPKKIWKFILLALFALIYALGANTPLFDLILLIPGANLFRTPGRMLMVVSFCFAIMAGYGLEYLLKKDRPLGKASDIFGVCLIILSISFTYVIFRFKTIILNFGKEVLQQLYYVTYADSIFVQQNSFESLLKLSNLVYTEASYAILYFTIFLGVIIIFSLFLNRSKSIFKFMIFLILITDIFFFNSQLVQGNDISESLKETDLVEFIKQKQSTESLFRVLAAEQSLFRQYFAMKYKIHKFLGASSSRISYFDKFLDQGLGIVDETHARIKWGELIIPSERMETQYLAKLLGMWNVEYILSKKEISNNDLELVLRSLDGFIYKNKKLLPRAYIVRNAQITTQEDIFRLMQSDSFNPKQILLLEQDPNYLLQNQGSFKEAKITNYTSNEITIKVYLKNPGYLVLADSYYPGWVASDNCIKRPVLKANYAMRAVYLEEGPHIIKFKREPTYFKIGSILTFTTSILLILYFLIYGIWKWQKKTKTTIHIGN